jgi:amidase
MAASELHYLELHELTALIHAKKLSTVEVTKSQFERIALLDEKLHSFAWLTSDLALSQARQAEREILKGEIRSALQGAPVGIKDLCWMKDVPTAAGMTIHKNFRPSRDAEVVRRLADAGAIMLGKLQMTEGAYGDHHPEVPAPVNPWDSERWPGVSSSGSGVATAAGLCYGSIGSDTGGSIRFPCAANGLTGLKPTWGRVSRDGVFELAATLDHVGPITRSVYDAALMLQAMAGFDEKDPTSSRKPVPDYLADIGGGFSGLAIGVDPLWNSFGTDTVTQRVVAEAIDKCREAGARIVEVRFPEAESIVASWTPHCAVEAAVAHEPTYPSRKDRYGPALARLIELGRGLSGMDYQKIILARLDFGGRVQSLFTEIDLLLVPAQAEASPTNARMTTVGVDPAQLAGLLRFTAPFDMAGNPTITLPGGFTVDGTPVAFQFVARKWGEAVLFRAGHAYQHVTNWHRQHPNLSHD